MGFFCSWVEGNYQESIQSMTTTDPRHHMGQWQNTRTHPRGQPFSSRWSQGCNKQTRQYNKDKKHKQQKWSTKEAPPGTFSKKNTGLWCPGFGRAVKGEKPLQRNWRSDALQPPWCNWLEWGQNKCSLARHQSKSLNKFGWNWSDGLGGKRRNNQKADWRTLCSCTPDKDIWYFTFG